MIELNGIKWHSNERSKIHDLKKKSIAEENGYQLITIFEDEWKKRNQIIKEILKTKLFSSKNLIFLRPNKCQIKQISSSTANTFYEQFHYIGRCKSIINYGVYFENKLIACASFSHPTRQSKYEWELVRMASDSAYRVHGIWSKLLKRFIHEHSPESIVSFSDNRLFSGGVYSKIGFRFDGEIPPDYYWTIGNDRYHKSNLRKTEEERKSGLTETQLREAQGYRRIWDLGKKRWVIFP